LMEETGFDPAFCQRVQSLAIHPKKAL